MEIDKPPNCAKNCDAFAQAAQDFRDIVAESGMLDAHYSPIEQLMGVGLLAAIYTQFAGPRNHNRFLRRATDSHFRDLPTLEQRGFLIAPQVFVGSFIPDFVVVARFDTVARGAIECDGASYHDDSDRVARDKARDRVLHGMGFSTLRYVTREIVEDPLARACEALTILQRNATH